MRIGLLQVQGIGDILIALPIAEWFINHGHEVLWPVNAAHQGFLQQAAPKVTFIGIEKERYSDIDFFSTVPQDLLAAHGCAIIINLYSYLPEKPIANPALAAALKFDEYKYAIARVPFIQKWTLSQILKRNIAREEAFYSRLNITKDYICLHLKGSNVSVDSATFDHWRDEYQFIEISEISDNPFDWIFTIENASKRIFLDSVFSNLVEQMNMAGDNYLIVRSPMPYTPVMKNGWTFITPAALP